MRYSHILLSFNSKITNIFDASIENIDESLVKISGLKVAKHHCETVYHPSEPFFSTHVEKSELKRIDGSFFVRYDDIDRKDFVFFRRFFGLNLKQKVLIFRAAFYNTENYEVITSKSNILVFDNKFDIHKKLDEINNDEDNVIITDENFSIIEYGNKFSFAYGYQNKFDSMI
jgi:hypothetical protein